MKAHKCQTCGGRGTVMDHKTSKEEICRACRGSGRVIISTI